MDLSVTVSFTSAGTCEFGEGALHARTTAQYVVANGVASPTFSCAAHLSDACEVMLAELADMLEGSAV